MWIKKGMELPDAQFHSLLKIQITDSKHVTSDSRFPMTEETVLSLLSENWMSRALLLTDT